MLVSLWPELRFLISVAKPAGLPFDSGREVAVAGRSNAGKSSAINALLARHALARTSRTPGRTQLFNYFELAPGRRIVDLPGYGHAAVVAGARENWGPLGEALLTRQSFVGLLLIVDCRRGIGPMDLHFLEWAGRSEDQVHVLLSKADKLGRGAGLDALRVARASLAGKGSCQLFSALKGAGLEEARAVIKRWLGS
jgi:GTP-binding protein